jgi:hypothetical protein
MPGQDLIYGHEPTSKIRRRTSGDRQPSTAASHPLVGLQRKIGNAQVARMLAQRQDIPEEELAAKRDPALQRQDEEELAPTRDPALQRQEEEELAPMRLQRQDVPEEELAAKRDPALQRQEEEELAPTRDPAIDREAAPEVGMAGGPISAGLTSRIESKRGSGSSLDSSTQQSMESGFGTSFADVRVHTDAESDSLNRSVGAKAFTVGSDIFFSQNASPSDGNLLAHELTHVVQQGGSKAASGPLTVTAANDAGEAEADSMATSVTSGAAAVQAQRHAAEETDR